jgi:hypothetical protein
MSRDFAQPTTDANKRIVESIMTGEDSHEVMMERLRQAFSVPGQADEGLRLPPQPSAQQVAASLPAATGTLRDSETHIRVIYPFGMSRFELVGSSEEDLDAQEARIRSLYPAR